MFSIGIDAVIISKESKDVRIQNLFGPATSLNESSVDIIVIESRNLLIVEEEGGLDGSKVDRVDKLVINVIQKAPFESVLLSILKNPLMQTFSTSTIDLTMVESKHRIELLSLLEHVKVSANDRNIRIDLLNVVKVMQNLLLPGSKDAETNHLKVASGPGAVGARRVDALNTRTGEIAFTEQRKIRELLIREM